MKHHSIFHSRSSTVKWNSPNCQPPRAHPQGRHGRQSSIQRTAAAGGPAGGPVCTCPSRLMKRVFAILDFSVSAAFGFYSDEDSNFNTGSACITLAWSVDATGFWASFLLQTDQLPSPRAAILPSPSLPLKPSLPIPLKTCLLTFLLLCFSPRRNGVHSIN